MATASAPRSALVGVIVVLAASTDLSAQRQTFRQYGPREGLTNLGVRCLLQDRTGFIWTGTDNGLFRYDGNSFRHFGLQEGLPTTGVLDLAESREGLLWVATENGFALGTANRFKPVETGVTGSAIAVAFDRLGRVSRVPVRNCPWSTRWQGIIPIQYGCFRPH